MINACPVYEYVLNMTLIFRQDEDPHPSPLQKIRSQICSILELFTLRYSDAFPPTLLAPFVQSVWEFLASRSEGSTREDVLVCRALGFLGVVVKMGSHRELFEQEGTLDRFLQMVVLPNMSLRSEFNRLVIPRRTGRQSS